MIEIVAIFLQILIFVLLTIFPFNSIFLSNNKKYFIKNNFAFTIGLNLLFLIFTLLIFSFFNIKQKIIFYILISIYLIILIFNLKKILNFKWSKNNLTLKFFYFFIILLLSFYTAESLEIGWDALEIWKFIANNFYLEETIYNLINREGRAMMYPHLGSYLWSFFWKNSLLEKEYYGRLFYIYIYVTAIFSLVLSIRNISIEKKIFLIFFFMISTLDSELHGYQDYLIFSFLIFFGVSLAQNIHATSNLLYITYFLVCSLLPWIKNEGLFYSIFLMILLIFKKNINKKKYFTISLIIFVFLCGEFFVKKYILSASTAFQTTINIKSFVNISLYDHLGKIIYIIGYFFRETLKYQIWIFNIIFIFISFIYYKQNEILKLIILFFLLNIFFIFLIYLLTPIDLRFQLNTTMDRLLLQTSGLYMISLIILINKKIIKL